LDSLLLSDFGGAVCDGLVDGLVSLRGSALRDGDFDSFAFVRGVAERSGAVLFSRAAGLFSRVLWPFSAVRGSIVAGRFTALRLSLPRFEAGT
jgi:hypothetical protein